MSISIDIETFSSSQPSRRRDYLFENTTRAALEIWAIANVDFDRAWSIRRVQRHDFLLDGRDFFVDVVPAMNEADDALDDAIARMKDRALCDARRDWAARPAFWRNRR